MRFFKAVWRFLSLARQSIFILLLVASLGFNVLLIVSESVFALVSGAVGATTGMMTTSARASGKVATLGADLDAQKQINRELREEATKTQASLVAERTAKREVQNELANQTAEAVMERKAARQIKDELALRSAQFAAEKVARDRIRGELAVQSAELIAERTARKKLHVGLSNVSSRVAGRARNALKRETSTMAGQAVPGWGLAVIIAATTAEMADLCFTIGDMQEIKHILDPTTTPMPKPYDFTVCGVEVPSKAELWSKVKTAPGAVWDATMEMLPGLPSVGDFSITDIEWSTLGPRALDKTLETGASIASGVSGAASTANDVVGKKLYTFDLWLRGQ